MHKVRQRAKEKRQKQAVAMCSWKEYLHVSFDVCEIFFDFSIISEEFMEWLCINAHTNDICSSTLRDAIYKVFQFYKVILSNNTIVILFTPAVDAVLILFMTHKIATAKCTVSKDKLRNGRTLAINSRVNVRFVISLYIPVYIHIYINIGEMCFVFVVARTFACW